MDAKEIKKVELHTHLDGSLRESTVSSIMGISEEEAREALTVSNDCQNLGEYLEKFSVPEKIMQTRQFLIKIARELKEALIEDNCIYAEVRFAPNKHKLILDLDDIIMAVLEALKSDKIMIKLILCMMRGDSYEDNKTVIDAAKKYQDKGVAGVDLAGNEATYKTSIYAGLFAYARDLNVPFTIHAGEADGVSSILAAIDFGATRIGHGVRAIEDSSVIDLLKAKNIHLEVCPTSNVHTHVSKSILEHPINGLKKLGVSLSVNTDNRAVSNITLTDEYNKLIEAFNYTEADFEAMNIEALNHAFISSDEKIYLIKKLKGLL